MTRRNSSQKYVLVWCILFFTIAVAALHPSKTVNKKKSRKCKKQGIKNFLFLYYIQAKCSNIANKNPKIYKSVNYRWHNILKKGNDL